MHEPAEAPKNFIAVWTKWRVHGIRLLTQLRKRWWVVLLTISLSLCGAAYYLSQLPPSFLSTGRMMVAGQIRLTEGAAYNEEFVNFFGTQLELMQSGEVRKRAEARVMALHPEMKPEPIKLQVGQLPRTSIFIMGTIGKSPVYTQIYLDACMDEYIATKKEMRSQKTDSTTAAIQDELVRLEKELATKEEEVHEFQKKNNLGFLREEGNSAAVLLAQLNRQLADLKTEFELLKLLNLEQNLDRGQVPSSAAPGTERRDTTLAAYGPMGDYQRAKQQVQLTKAERDDFSRYLKPKHPTIVALDEQIERGGKLLEMFRTQSVEALQTRQESIRLQIQNLETAIKESETRALELSRRVAEFDKIKTSGDRIKGQYDRLLTNLRNVDVTKQLEQDTISILEKASQAVSTKPGLPKVLWRGLIFGLVISLGIIFVMDKLDDRVTSFGEFRNSFPEHILGEIPRELGDGAAALLQRNDPRHALLESFSTLRSSLVFLPMEGPRPKTLMVTSAAPSEGKTTVATNFAITLAFSGAKVLLIDADLRRGRLHTLFETPPGHGLSEVLRGRVPWQEAVVPTSTANLFVLPRGKALSHPAEYLLSKTTDDLLRETKEAYDYVVFDSAPVLVADDALSLAPKVDGLLFVFRFSQSSIRQGRHALDALANRQTNMLGLVCNDVGSSEAEYGYGNYDHYSDQESSERDQ